MSDTIVLSTSHATRSATIATREERILEQRGAHLLGRLGHGVVARVPSGTPLDVHGFDITRYPDTNLLQIAGFRIDLEKGVQLPPSEDVPDDAKETWPLHIVQLAGPAFPEWIREIETANVTVIERAGKYGLYVHALPGEVAALRRLPFVVYTGPLAPAWKVDPRLRGAPAGGELALTVYPPEELERVAELVEARGGTIVRREALLPGRLARGARLVVRAGADRAPDLARDPAVRTVAWLPPVTFDGEREVQILTESFDAAAPPGTSPVPGYAAWLAAAGATGAGATISVVDSGVDVGANNNATGHLDLRGRQTAWFDYNGVAQDFNGHGTHVTAIAVGNAATGAVEGAAPDNFLWGQGMAPAASFVAQSVANPADPSGASLVLPAFDTLTTDAVDNGATIQNNSWSGTGSPFSYTDMEAQYDALVRDANPTTATGEPLAISFSASNAGGLARTLGDPSSAKNTICVGSALTARPTVRFPDDDIRGIAPYSSRGPASGDRLKPDIVAPGTDVSAARGSVASATASPPIVGAAQYTYKSGTSQASPHVVGMCAVLTEWWRNRTHGRTPSPAMLKALLVNGAEDLVGGSNWRRVRGTPIGGNRFTVTIGFAPTRIVVSNTLLTQVASAAVLVNNSWFFDAATNTLTVQFVSTANPLRIEAQDGALAHIPNNDQGWGRVSLDNILYQTPDSDRGPRLFLDQRRAFTANGQSHSWRVRPVDVARPLRITLAWTDAPGAALDTSPLVNDLDLRVVRESDSALFQGGPANFTNGFSTPGGAPDTVNNVECVYIQNPAGVFEVTVRATTVTTNARPPFDATPWQDYALVLENAEFAAAAPVDVSVLLDRSGSMVAFGYVDVTREASKLFVDLMHADDKLGVVSFGDSALDAFAPGGALATITDGTVQAAARTAIDSVSFSGCTYMGAGLQRAAQLLGSGPGAVVLLSDGMDNKGCHAADASRPWATDVAAGLPANLDVYTCAMGPMSDQVKLEQIAQATGGQYYFMPTIDDLHEIYNYIRGNVSGDGVIVNATGAASSARVSALVDCDAELATFAVHWHAKGLRWVGGDPKKSDEIAVSLRTPSGRRVPANASWVRRVVGDGYIVLRVPEPEAGVWYVEISTARAEHTPFTVGGWVRSPLQLVWTHPTRVGAFSTASVRLGLLKDPGRPLDVRYTATVTAPGFVVSDVLASHKDELANVRPIQKLVTDGYPIDLARVAALDGARRAAGKPSLFGWTKTAAPVMERPRVERLAGSIDAAREIGTSVLRASLNRVALANPDAIRAKLLGSLTHDVRFGLQKPGSYTLRLSVSGVDLRTRCRFVRRAAGSFVAAQR